MKRGDIFLIILAAALLIAMLLTIIFKGGKSRHGYGAFLKIKPQTFSSLSSSAQPEHPLDLF